MNKFSPAFKSTSSSTTLGWFEAAGLPLLGIEKIYAKIDSGAEGSTLHATQISHLRLEGEPLVEFTAPLLRVQRDASPFALGGVRRVRAPLVKVRRIVSSTGHTEERPIIRTRLCLGSKTLEAELSLTSRESLRFGLLLGRDILAGRFLIDTAKSEMLPLDLSTSVL